MKVSVPPQLGYGSRGLPPAVPAGAILLFDVEVRSVTTASHTAATLVGVGLLLCAVAAAAVNTQQRRDRECCSSRYSDPAAADADGGGGPAYSLVTGTAPPTRNPPASLSCCVWPTADACLRLSRGMLCWVDGRP